MRSCFSISKSLYIGYFFYTFKYIELTLNLWDEVYLIIVDYFFVLFMSI